MFIFIDFFFAEREPCIIYTMFKTIPLELLLLIIIITKIFE